MDKFPQKEIVSVGLSCFVPSKITRGLATSILRPTEEVNICTINTINALNDVLRNIP